jgi:heat shock protein HtpX
MKRIFLFVLTNLLVVVTLGVVASVLGVNRWLTANGIDFGALLMFSFLFGFGGAFISLLISKPVAKWSMGARVITGNEGSAEAWLVQTVAAIATRAGIRMPEVAVYEGAPNAFATGAFKNSALVAVSTGLLQQMDRSQVEAVLGHEVSHVANGDMVTLALIQGVMNTFVIFLSRVVGYAVDRVLLKNESDSPGVGYYVSVVVLDILFGLLAAVVVAWFSRWREYRADAGSARLLGQAGPMVSALQALGRMQGGTLPANLQAFGITGGGRVREWFASHPPIEKRIAALQSRAAA